MAVFQYLQTKQLTERRIEQLQQELEQLEEQAREAGLDITADAAYRQPAQGKEQGVHGRLEEFELASIE